MKASRIKELRRARGMTLEELATRVGTSKQTISRYENGIISNIPPERILSLAEALYTTPSVLMGWEYDTEPHSEEQQNNRAKRLPMLGEIACGNPIYASEEYDSYISVTGDVDADFCLKAHGDSMTGARIFDGDIVFIRKQSLVNNGEIAAIIINDEATLKRVYFYPEDGKLILCPENPRFAPLVFIGSELNDVKIIGKAVAFQSAVV
jgi:repressor LexA